jgi:hypothetical protein
MSDRRREGLPAEHRSDLDVAGVTRFREWFLKKLSSLCLNVVCARLRQGWMSPTDSLGC